MKIIELDPEQAKAVAKELFKRALEQGRKASERIHTFSYTPFMPNETPEQRAFKLAPFAVALMDAFETIDSLLASGAVTQTDAAIVVVHDGDDKLNPPVDTTGLN